MLPTIAAANSVTRSSPTFRDMTAQAVSSRPLEPDEGRFMGGDQYGRGLRERAPGPDARSVAFAPIDRSCVSAREELRDDEKAIAPNIDGHRRIRSVMCHEANALSTAAREMESPRDVERAVARNGYRRFDGVRR